MKLCSNEPIWQRTLAQAGDNGQPVGIYGASFGGVWLYIRDRRAHFKSADDARTYLANERKRAVELAAEASKYAADLFNVCDKP